MRDAAQGTNQFKLKRRFKFWLPIFILTGITIYTVGLILFMNAFLTHYELRTPVILRAPWEQRANGFVSPLSPKKAEAAEIPNVEVKAQTIDTFNPQEVREYVKYRTIEHFGQGHWEAMDALMMGESGYQTYTINKSSGACGIFQALPCEKIGPKGLDLENQVTWGLDYLEKRYGNPTNAYQFWLSKSPHWY